MTSNNSVMYYDKVNQYKEQHETLVDIITTAVNCENIFLLATSYNKSWTESLFNMQSPGCMHVSHYFLLVIVSKTDKDPNMQIQERVEGRLQHFIPSTVIVLDIDQFNKWLKEGHPFACLTATKACVLYAQNRHETPFAGKVNEEKIRLDNESIYSKGLNKVQEFLAGADLYRIREQNKMAAFMLHQALEQALRSMLIMATGLNIATHSIDRLLRYCSMFAYALTDIFPRNNDKNEKMFQLMQKAYIDTRYKDDYSISTKDLITLTNRVRMVQDLLEDTMKQ